MTYEQKSDQLSRIREKIGKSSDRRQHLQLCHGEGKGKTDDPTPIPAKGQPTSIPLDEEKPYSYHGYNVPERYLNMIRGLMEDDIKEGRADKK